MQEKHVVVFAENDPSNQTSNSAITEQKFECFLGSMATKFCE